MANARGCRRLSSAAGKIPAVRDLISEAENLTNQGNLAEAAEKMEQAVCMSPEDSRDLAGLAGLYQVHRQLEPAIELARKAMRADLSNAPLQESLLRMLIDSGRVDEAIEACRELIHLFPRNVIARDVLAMALLQRGLIDEALRVVEESIRLDPTTPEHQFKKAVLLQQKGLISAAMSCFLRAIDMDPDSDIAEEARGSVAALDGLQIRQILMLASEDLVFRTKLAMDSASAYMERGFLLSSAGANMLRQLDMQSLPADRSCARYN